MVLKVAWKSIGDRVNGKLTGFAELVIKQCCMPTSELIVSLG